MEFQKAKLIVGLGNPGTKYDGTRHNIGRKLVEEFASFGAHPLGAEFRITNGYMNTSGAEVIQWVAKMRIKPQEALIVLDEFQLPLGQIKILKNGSGGGHNGLQSVVDAVGTEDIPRLRIGIGPLPEGDDPAEFVLRKFTSAQEAQLRTILPKAKDAVEMSISQGIEVAMNQFNGRTF